MIWNHKDSKFGNKTKQVYKKCVGSMNKKKANNMTVELIVNLMFIVVILENGKELSLSSRDGESKLEGG